MARHDNIGEYDLVEIKRMDFVPWRGDPNGRFVSSQLPVRHMRMEEKTGDFVMDILKPIYDSDTQRRKLSDASYHHQSKSMDELSI